MLRSRLICIAKYLKIRNMKIAHLFLKKNHCACSNEETFLQDFLEVCGH